MKVFVFLTLIAFSSAHYTGSAHSRIRGPAHDEVPEIQAVLDATFSAATSDISAGIDYIINLLGKPESASELRLILEDGVLKAHNIVADLADLIDTNGNGSVKDEAQAALEKFKAHVLNQFGIFEQRAVQDANADQKSQVHDYIQGMIKQCFQNLEPLFNRINQMA